MRLFRYLLRICGISRNRSLNNPRAAEAARARRVDLLGSGPVQLGAPIDWHRDFKSGRTTTAQGYQTSQRIRKRIEEAFGWIKTVAGHDKTRFRGVDRVAWAFRFTAAAYNLVRLPKLLADVA